MIHISIQSESKLSVSFRIGGICLGHEQTSTPQR